jgi:hypothetical protein
MHACVDHIELNVLCALKVRVVYFAWFLFIRILNYLSNLLFLLHQRHHQRQEPINSSY